MGGHQRPNALVREQASRKAVGNGALRLRQRLKRVGINPGSDSVVNANLPAGAYVLNWSLEFAAIAAGYIGFLVFALRFNSQGSSHTMPCLNSRVCQFTEVKM